MIRTPTSIRRTQRICARFLTLVGTRADTHVKITTTTRVIPGGPVAETQPGGVIEATLQPFDVLNLETDGFNL
ncbi:MAG: hypothetical protein U0165_14485 [Polyangiaceae bacterium]